MAIEIVDFPIKHGDFPWQNVSSPEGKTMCYVWKELAGTCNHPSKESVVVTSCLTHDWATKCSIMYHCIYQETLTIYFTRANQGCSS